MITARGLFNDAAEADQQCAIALWGVSMTYIHPLWPDRPSSEILSIGAELSTRAVTVGQDYLLFQTMFHRVLIRFVRAAEVCPWGELQIRGSTKLR